MAMFHKREKYTHHESSGKRGLLSEQAVLFHLLEDLWAEEIGDQPKHPEPLRCLAELGRHLSEKQRHRKGACVQKTWPLRVDQIRAAA
jgi:hypothetical protein